jgi:hydrogenase maturation protein HypF
MGIKGEVENHTDGLRLRALFPSEEACERLLERIRKEHPPVASIHTIHISSATEEPAYTTFSITPSRKERNDFTLVSPDIAVCPACLNERATQAHRLNYPFINCMHCGPRFTILRELPYDREQTSMSAFHICPTCRKEYEEETDRRFHAQPIACKQCGPSYYTTGTDGEHTDYAQLLNLSAELLNKGEVIAAKGMGGYHLICDALNEQAVSRLREIKQRDSKPFALMFADVEAVRNYAFVDEAEEAELCSWRRPIVVLQQRKPVAAAVNQGMRSLGVMLPYMPLHYDWFERLATPALVMSSGNLREQPIACTEAEAREQFGGKVALILHHNRAIHNRADDSVLQVCEGRPRLIRRSRGYVPEPVVVDRPVEGILAFGGEQSNTFALGRGDMILPSQHIGDLKSWENFRFYTEAIEHFQRLFRFRARLLVCDRHPDYLSTREAERMAAAGGLPLLRVQHHHAHAVACMAEYGLSRPLIAIILDGTGWGDDGHIWGGEFFLCDRRSYQRLAQLAYMPMPGGDRAVREPWRMAVAYLHCWGLPLPESFKRRIGAERIAQTERMIDRQLHTPLSSGAGRLFDAVASLLGLCDLATHQAEAPMLLEQAAAGSEALPYPFSCSEAVISLRPMMEALLSDMAQGLPTGLIAARFHLTLAHLLTAKAQALVKQYGASEVVVSGGCFQNKYLCTLLRHLFDRAKLPLYIPSRIPCNDGGLSSGQVLIASCFA